MSNIDTFMEGRKTVNDAVVELTGISRELNEQNNTYLAVRLLEISVTLLAGGKEMFEGFRGELDDMNKEFDKTLKLINKN